MLLLGIFGLALVAGAVLLPHSASSRSPVSNPVLRRALDAELGRAPRQAGAPMISSGVMYSLLDQTGALRRRAERLPARCTGANDLDERSQHSR